MLGISWLMFPPILMNPINKICIYNMGTNRLLFQTKLKIHRKMDFKAKYWQRVLRDISFASYCTQPAKSCSLKPEITI